MGTRPRLPNNVIWSIEDATAAAVELWEDLARVRKRAERVEDALTLGAVGRCMERLVVIEHHLRNARCGRYEARVEGSEADDERDSGKGSGPDVAGAGADGGGSGVGVGVVGRRK